MPSPQGLPAALETGAVNSLLWGVGVSPSHAPVGTFSANESRTWFIARTPATTTVAPTSCAPGGAMKAV